MMEFLEIGVVVKPHGLKGAVVIKASTAYASQFLDFSTLYLEQMGTKVPYLITECAPLGVDIFKVHFRGIDSPEKAEAMRKLLVFQLASQLVMNDEQDWDGFQLKTEDGITIGTVIDQMDNKAHIILVVEAESGEEHYIPLVEEYLIRAEVSKKELVMKLPDGLLDL